MIAPISFQFVATPSFFLDYRLVLCFKIRLVITELTSESFTFSPFVSGLAAKAMRNYFFNCTSESYSLFRKISVVFRNKVNSVLLTTAILKIDLQQYLILKCAQILALLTDSSSLSMALFCSGITKYAWCYCITYWQYSYTNVFLCQNNNLGIPRF